MGNVSNHLGCDERQHTFVGRETDIVKICGALDGTKKNIIQIKGMQEIGKSRLLTQIIKKYVDKRKCIFKDFSLERPNLDSNDIVKFLIGLSRELNGEDSTVYAGNESLTVEDALKLVVKMAAVIDEDVVLFLDNVDTLFACALFKNQMLNFLNDICNKASNKFKVVFTTTENVHMGTKGFLSHEMCLLELRHVQKLLISVIKDKAGIDEDNDAEQVSMDYQSNEDSESSVESDNEDGMFSNITSEQNKHYLDALARLCAGLPKIVAILGAELTADNGLLQPRDLLVLMVEDNLNTLSPDCYPSADRADTYKRTIEKLKERRCLIDKINSEMDQNNTASLETVVECADSARNTAEAKQIMKPLLNHNMMKYKNKQEMFQMQTIFRECILATKLLDEKKDDETTKLLKNVRLQMAKLPGVPDGIANSSIDFENFLKLQEDCDIIDLKYQRMESSQPEDEVDESPDKAHQCFTTPYTEENMHVDKIAIVSVCPRCHSSVEFNKDYVVDNNLNKCRCFEEQEKHPNKSFDSLSGPRAMSYRNISCSGTDTVQTLPHQSIIAVAVTTEVTHVENTLPSARNENRTDTGLNTLTNKLSDDIQRRYDATNINIPGEPDAVDRAYSQEDNSIAEGVELLTEQSPSDSVTRPKMAAKHTDVSQDINRTLDTDLGIPEVCEIGTIGQDEIGEATCEKHEKEKLSSACRVRENIEETTAVTIRHEHEHADIMHDVEMKSKTTLKTKTLLHGTLEQNGVRSLNDSD